MEDWSGTLDYTYTRPDTWRRWTADEGVAFWEGETDPEAGLLAHGYEDTHSHGLGEIGGLVIWTADVARVPFYAVIDMRLPGGRCCFVYLPTPPDFLDFLARYGVIGYWGSVVAQAEAAITQMGLRRGHAPGTR